jgi:hypothetical protein
MDQTMTKHPAEALAEMLGDPLPADWQDELAVQARQDHLAALAYGASDAVVDLLLSQFDAAQRGERVTAGDRVLTAFVDSLMALDKGWRTYVRQTQRGDAGQLVFDAANFWAGAVVATAVEALLHRVHAISREVVAERVAEIESGGG